MKSQLLEDIGQSAALSLEPSGKVVNSGSQSVVQELAQASAAKPVRPRSTTGVWRKKPEAEPPPLPMPPTVPFEAAPEPQGPVFDFTLPEPASPASDVPKQAPTLPARSGKRYLLWGTCVLATALVAQLGWWLYENQKDQGVLALVADELQTQPQPESAVKRRTMGAKEFTLGPDGEVSVAPAAPVSAPSPPPRAAEPVPPLVLLPPEPAPVPAAKAVRVKEERVADQPAREPVMAAAKKAEPESGVDATLKACREHGYHAAQCVKRGCSVTKYGFVCRGS